MIRVGSPEDHGLALDVIQIDGGTQSRAALNQHVVDDYAEAIKGGATFPPIVVFYDGKKHWLADGFHRFHAYQKAGKTKVAADVRQGTRRDAILHSVGANETHGLRRTRDDKRRAVLTLLNDAEWSAKPERWIATTANVSHTYVQKIRAEHLATLPDRPAEVEVQRGGTVYTQKVAKAAKSNAREALVNDEPSPEAGPQAEASHVGTDTGMPADREGRHEGEAASVDLPAIPRNIVAEVCELWNVATPSEREEIRAIINSVSDDGPEGRKRLQVAREPINAAEPDVLAATREGLSMERGIDQCVTAGETALNSQSDDDAFSEVKGTARPENAAGVEPSSSEPEAIPSPPPASGNPFPDPLTPVVATADQAHQASQLPAQNDDVPHVVGQGGHEPVNHYGHAEQEDASAPQARNEPGSASGATVTNFAAMSKADQIRLLRPHCQHPDDLEKCGGSGRNHCHGCKKAMAESEAA